MQCKCTIRTTSAPIFLNNFFDGDLLFLVDFFDCGDKSEVCASLMMSITEQRRLPRRPAVGDGIGLNPETIDMSKPSVIPLVAFVVAYQISAGCTTLWVVASIIRSDVKTKKQQSTLS